MEHKIETTHLVLTRTIFRMRDEDMGNIVNDSSLSDEAKQKMVAQLLDQIERMERLRSEIMNILWA